MFTGACSYLPVYACVYVCDRPHTQEDNITTRNHIGAHNSPFRLHLDFEVLATVAGGMVV